MNFQKLSNCWMDELDQIIKFLEPCDFVNFASVSKNKTALIQKYLKKISKKYKDYGFKTSDEALIINLPHQKCLMKVWWDNGYCDLQGYNFFGGPCFQFASKAIVKITKINKRSDCSYIVYGWCLGGEGTYKMMNGDGKKYFRPYPFWSYITHNNYKRFSFVPYK